MDYTPRVMDAPGFIVAALTTCPLASEEESEWMEQAHNFRVGHGGVDRTMHKLGLMGRSWSYIATTSGCSYGIVRAARR